MVEQKSGPVIFAVERRAGGETASVYFEDRLPERLTRKIPRTPDGQLAEPGPLVYAVRLDKLPNGSAFISMPLCCLYSEFCRLRALGKLPPSNLTEPPLKGAEGRKGAILGEWWEPPARTWEDRPADPYPEPDAIKPKLDAPGYIGQRGGYLPIT